MKEVLKLEKITKKYQAKNDIAQAALGAILRRQRETAHLDENLFNLALFGLTHNLVKVNLATLASDVVVVQMQGDNPIGVCLHHFAHVGSRFVSIKRVKFEPYQLLMTPLCQLLENRALVTRLQLRL